MTLSELNANQFLVHSRDTVGLNCAWGVRAFFRANELDMRAFCAEGIPAIELLNTNDALAARVVEAARERHTKTLEGATQ